MTQYTLSSLNQIIKNALHHGVPSQLWLRAEIHGITNHATGHCYLELIEKEENSDNIIAKSRATIWARTYAPLREKFLAATNAQLTVGIKILVLVSVEIHELYGFSLNIKDIDPTYTLGDLQRRRLEIINKLRATGLMERNKQIAIPPIPQQIAVISSATAAGYKDFQDQLLHNPYGFAYNTTLYAATMQGTQTEASILNALNQIYESKIAYHIIVIIRGGGASSDLQAFDSENLAIACAKSSIAIISGIGHTKDQSILDMVAHTSVKTPTAAAEFIINITLDTAMNLQLLGDSLQRATLRQLGESDERLQRIGMRLMSNCKQLLMRQQMRHEIVQEKLTSSTTRRIEKERRTLELFTTSLRLLDPHTILKKGYTMSIIDGHVASSVSQLTSGSRLTTIFADGTATSEIKTIKNKK